MENIAVDLLRRYAPFVGQSGIVGRRFPLRPDENIGLHRVGPVPQPQGEDSVARDHFDLAFDREIVDRLEFAKNDAAVESEAVAQRFVGLRIDVVASRAGVFERQAAATGRCR